MIQGHMTIYQCLVSDLISFAKPWLSLSVLVLTPRRFFFPRRVQLSTPLNALQV